jgi:hypothetical protein
MSEVRKSSGKNLLSTWKEIASYLGVKIRTCYRYEKKYGMPVHRMEDSPKSRVYAYRDELDRWMESNFGKKTSIENRDSQKSKRIPTILVPVLMIGAGILFVSFIVFKSSANGIPSDFKIQESELVIINEKGSELGRYDTGLTNLLSEKEYRERFQHKKRIAMQYKYPYIKIIDLDEDGEKEILFSVQTQSESREGKLLCLNREANVLWEIDTGRELKFGDTFYSCDYRIYGFDTEDIDSDGNLEIILIANHRQDFPTQLAVLNNGGKILGEFWNSGRMMSFIFQDLDFDKKNELIISAMNNEYKKGCVIVFDPANIRGSSPQMRDYYKCGDLERGSERFYILFPRTDVDIKKTQVEAILNIEVLQNNRLSLFSQVGRIDFQLDFQMKIQDVLLSDDFEQMHRKAFEEGEIASQIDDQYIQNLKEGLLYFDGESWVSDPTMVIYSVENKK